MKGVNRRGQRRKERMHNRRIKKKQEVREEHSDQVRGEWMSLRKRGEAVNS